MKTIKQECDCKIIHDIKTVDWLVRNTRVRTFDNIKFTGYQRQVNKNHVSNIVKYLKENPFYLPTSIICASEEEYTEDTILNIVDGQHRVEAFKELEKKDSDKYNSLKNCELSVVILEKPTEELEVDTFITINKTSKKVDTSLAYVLKNIINKDRTSSSDLTIAKTEFLAVELAINLNNDKNSLWYNRILLEGTPTNNSYETISLNSFVKSIQMLISYFNKYKIIEIDWENENKLNEIIDKIQYIYLKIWDALKLRWPNLFVEESVNSAVLQGAIGVSAINKYIILQLKKQNKPYYLEQFISEVEYWIENINISQEEWYKGKSFSEYSSAAGANIVANTLLKAFEQ